MVVDELRVLHMDWSDFVKRRSPDADRRNLISLSDEKSERGELVR